MIETDDETKNLPDLLKRYGSLILNIDRDFRVGVTWFHFDSMGTLFRGTSEVEDYNELTQEFQQELERQVADAVTEAIREAEERLIALRALVMP